MEAVAANYLKLYSLCLYSGGSGRGLPFIVFSVFVQWRQWPQTLICCILCVCTVEAVATHSHLLHSVCFYSGGCGRRLLFVAFCVFVQRRQWPRTLICCILCVCTVEAVATHSHLLHFVCLYSGCCGRGLSFIAFCVFVQWRLWPWTLICCILCVCTVDAVAADSLLLHFVCLYSGGCGRGLSFIAFCVFVQWRQWPRTPIYCIMCVCTVEAVAADSYLLHFVCLYSGGSGQARSFLAFCLFIIIICCILCVCTVEAVAADSHLLHSVYFYSGGCGRELS